MKKWFIVFGLFTLGISTHFLVGCTGLHTPQNPITGSTHTLGWDDGIHDRKPLLMAVDNSITYIRSGRAERAYASQNAPMATRVEVERSLIRFRELLLSEKTPEALQTAVVREFRFRKAAGRTGNGDVLFTAYYQPIHLGSRVRTDTFQYPVFGLPSDFSVWPKPHPTRVTLEGKDGKGLSGAQLNGYEIVYLSDRMEVQLLQTQGSGIIWLTDGGEMALGFAGGTAHPYTSIGAALIRDKKMKTVDILSLKNYFNEHPTERDNYISSNNRFVFFKEMSTTDAIGSLGVPLTAWRSIATDKSVFPPGALTFIQGQLPKNSESTVVHEGTVGRYALDQDTGSAIKGPGRVDLFIGTGDKAGEIAGRVKTTGELYYLLLK